MRLGTPNRPIWTVLSRRDLWTRAYVYEFCREADERDGATNCPGHGTSASVTEVRRLCRLLAFHLFLTCCPTSAFIKADRVFRAAGHICGRLPAFFVAGFRVAAGLDPRFRSAPPSFHCCCCCCCC